MNIIAYINKVKSRWTHEGIRFPLMHDPITKKPSITLMFPYFSFILMMVGLGLLLKENTLYGAIGAGIVWLLATILYLLRKLTKAKVDLDDKSIELENEDDDDEKEDSSK